MPLKFNKRSQEINNIIKISAYSVSPERKIAAQ